MTEQLLSEYKRLIESKKSEVERYLGAWDDIAVQRAPDALDEGQLASDRDLAIATKDRSSELLRELRGALERLADGTFGSCRDCGDSIKAARLRAVPWAAFCPQCQEAIDAEGRHYAESLSAELGEAA